MLIQGHTNNRSGIVDFGSGSRERLFLTEFKTVVFSFYFNQRIRSRSGWGGPLQLESARNTNTNRTQNTSRYFLGKHWGELANTRGFWLYPVPYQRMIQHFYSIRRVYPICKRTEQKVCDVRHLLLVAHLATDQCKESRLDVCI